MPFPLFNIVGMMYCRVQQNEEWAPEGRVYAVLSRIFINCISLVKDSADELFLFKVDVAPTSPCQIVLEGLISVLRKSLGMLLSSHCCISKCQVVSTDCFSTFLPIFENFLHAIENLYKACRDSQGALDASNGAYPCNNNDVPEEAVDARILDADFDTVDKTIMKDSVGSNNIRLRDHMNLKQKWMIDCVAIISCFALRLPEKTCDSLLGLLHGEEDPVVRVTSIHLHFLA
jgi:hypothetical protein